ncbi:hypothetical protein KEU06_23470 [Pseudaminobacter sp. 19-2017]|uniref:Uncharacterized protein n=1 Tax=Pseudaminobacter soli (ex Zhang et al. 2022) TaxID=2831468 RepID=A0A942EAP8_9HYPH|nr:hypothetical protein [Pseudaminobacter soli]MBS3651582.1 hypothetical protein [Pseudaminobacter soli]
MIHPVTIADAVADFLEGACPGQLLSLARAVNQIRSIFPQCHLTDVELAEVVAIRAMEMGFVSVMFDLSRTQRRGNGGSSASEGRLDAGEG